MTEPNANDTTPPGKPPKNGAPTSRRSSSEKRTSTPKKAASPPVDSPGFASLGLSSAMLEALRHAGYEMPTPIQGGLIPKALEGIDLIGQAKTGTGKTAAFAIPILERLVKRAGSEGPQALILVPTRELAVQVRDEFDKLAHGRRIACVAVYGGKPIRGQIDKLQRGPQVVVGTPGRVLDHIHRNTLRLGQLTNVVLDEADRMLDIGFRPDIERILRHCPKDRQTLLLSATVPPPIRRLAERYMRNPETVDFSPSEMTVETIEQHYFTVANERKAELLLRLLVREKPKQAIIFCRTKRGAERTGNRLAKRVKSVDCIHGDMGQGARDRVMGSFRKGTLRFLVATDVVGRGIDVSGVSHIINYDIPQFCDDYVHRVGRTGRMGREGVAYTFVSPEEGGELTKIEQRINRLLVRDEMKGFDAGDNPPLASPSGTTTDGEGIVTPLDKEPPPPPPGRQPKRYRRAL